MVATGGRYHSVRIQFSVPTNKRGDDDLHCLDSLLLPITTLINLSISESIFPNEFKSAIVTPLHKKHSLPIEDLSSYRPISNLNFISKIFERIINNRLNRHLFPLYLPFSLHTANFTLLKLLSS